MNENMPLKYKQMHLDHDLSASVCHLTYPTLSAFVKWYSEVVNRKEDRQYNGLKKTSAKHYTEN
jgi:ABC-type phosphate/phosphonate transport system permease subunit